MWFVSVSRQLWLADSGGDVLLRPPGGDGRSSADLDVIHQRTEHETDVLKGTFVDLEPSRISNKLRFWTDKIKPVRNDRRDGEHLSTIWNYLDQ